MCTQYIPPEPREIVSWFDSLEPTFAYKARVYKGYDAPIFVKPGAQDSQAIPLALRRARFGLVPFFEKSLQVRYSTMNARAETAATSPSYRGPWKRRQLCIVPIARFIEPNWESGKSEWWGIGRSDGQPLAAAGLYDVWRPKQPDEDTAEPAPPVFSFTLLTVNADGHSLMQRFHRPGDEKRSIVLLERDQLQAWLHADTDQDVRSNLRLFDAEGFTAGPMPPPATGASGPRAAPIFDA